MPPDTTHAAIGADAWSDNDLARIYKQANGEDVGKAQPLTTKRIFQAMRTAAALASAAQPAPAHQRAMENVALLADILNRRPALNAGLRDAYTHWTAEVYALMGAMAAEPANDAAAPKAAPAQPTDPVTIEAVAKVVRHDEGIGLDWLIEGGISALAVGEVLVCANAAVTDDTGSGEVYLAPAAAAPKAAPAVEQEPVGWAKNLHTFLNAAAGEGFVLDGVDAADLYIAAFPQTYYRATEDFDALAAMHPAPAAQGDAPPRLKVRVTSFPESNGRRNWTALLVRAEPWDGLPGNCGGVTLARGELWNRVAYEAERARFLIGERDAEPCIRDYAIDITRPELWGGEVHAARAQAKEGGQT